MRKQFSSVNHEIRKKVFGDSWYAVEMHDICDSLDERLKTNVPPIIVAAAKRFGIVRGALLFAFSRTYATVVTCPSTHGFLPFLFLEYLFSGETHRVVLLEFIRGEAPNNFLRRLIHPLWLKVFVGPVFRKTIRYAHILSEYEQERYSQLYRIPKQSFVFVPWLMRLPSDVMPERCLVVAKSDTVVASGRAACDWGLIFKASAGQPWPLVVICSKKDFAQVVRLNSDNRAIVLCDITREAHQRYVREAAVYVLSLRETYYSAGHVRLRDCVREGTPVIATDVTALKGYIIHNETGILTPPADPSAMRRAIETMLADRSRGRNMAKLAFEVAGNCTREVYLEKIGHLLLS